MEFEFTLRKVTKPILDMAALLLTSLISISATSSVASTVSYQQSYATHWNLSGNSLSTGIDVRSTFGSQNSIQSVWKWDAAGSSWAFYAPSLDSLGTLGAYALSKGYAVLTTINPGEGYWVNATAPLSVGTLNGTGYTLAASHLVTGWNLVATGDNVTAGVFTTSVGHVTTLWAWNNATSSWYFNAPALVANGTLASYIQSKNYLDFGSLDLGNGRGFWVNYAGSTTGGTVPVAGQMGGAILGTSLNLMPAIVTTFAGAGVSGSADGTGKAASFGNPYGITTDGSNLYVADYANMKIRKIVIATGVVTTLAGSGATGAANGTGTAASFNAPGGITTDGSNLYVSDTKNNIIRKIVIATGAVTTLAGSGTPGSAEGTGTAATFNSPYGITTDGSNLYVSDYGAAKIRKIVIVTGAVTTLAGSGVFGAADGTGAAASFGQPIGITTDGSNLYVADMGNQKIRKIVIATGVVTTLAGSGASGASDGTGAAATFSGPFGIATDGTNLYVTDGVRRIRKIVIATAAVTTLAGSATLSSVDGIGSAATFNFPTAITTDGSDLYVSEFVKIRKISAKNSTSVPVPSAPVGVTTTATSATQISVNWTNVSGATAYSIYRSMSPNVQLIAANQITAPNAEPTAGPFADSGLAATTTYYYRVTAVNATGESVGSAELAATTMAAVNPPMPASGTLTGFPSELSFTAGSVTVNPLFATYGSPPMQDADIIITNSDRSISIIVSGEVVNDAGGPHALSLNAQTAAYDAFFSPIYEWNEGLCHDSTYPANCVALAGVTIDRVGRKITFTNAKLNYPNGTKAIAFGVLTLNGTVSW